MADISFITVTLYSMQTLPISGPDKSLHQIQLGLSRGATAQYTRRTGKTAATPAQLISVAALISQKKKNYSKLKPERDMGED